MKRRIAALLLLFCTGLMLTACAVVPEEQPEVSSILVFSDDEEEPTSVTEEETDEPDTEIRDEEQTEPQPTEAQTTVPDAGEVQTNPAIPDEEPEDDPVPQIDPDGSYTSPEDVAAYIHTFGTLPGNFITKRQAQDRGWVSSEGNLWDVAPGMSIGGDYFGNREGLLPDGNYHECDVNYSGGFRQSERLIYGDDGSIYYTSDHYASFTQLY